MAKGIVFCENCKWHQPWISRSGWKSGKIATSNCMKCGKRNRFYPHRFHSAGHLTETRGRKPAVWFRWRPDWTILLQLIEESRHRNRGTLPEEEWPTFSRADTATERASQEGQRDWSREDIKEIVSRIVDEMEFEKFGDD